MSKLNFQLIFLLAIFSYGRCQTVTTPPLSPPPSLPPAPLQPSAEEIKISELAPVAEMSDEKQELPEPEELPVVANQENRPAMPQVQVQVQHMPLMNGPNNQFPPRQMRVYTRGVIPTSLHRQVHSFIPSQSQHSVPFSIPLPPRNQPVNQGSLQCKQAANDQHSRRDLSKRSLYLQNLETFYLNPKNGDVMFSVCGSLFPAHLIIIESVSTKFENLISNRKKGDSVNPITIESVEDLVGTNSLISNEIPTSFENATIPKTTNCPDETLMQAFKIFLKYFYFDSVAFDEINSLEVSFLVWKLGSTFLVNGTARQEIEEKIASLLTVQDLSKAYRFFKENEIEFLNKKWSKFIFNHANDVAHPNGLSVTCDEIDGDTDYLDHFIEALNLNQARAIFYIRHYLDSCPQFANLTVSGVNLFPHSLLFFRCTVDDLKELRKMGFISYEILSEEFENRLHSLDRQCSVKQSPPHQPIDTIAANIRRELETRYGPGNVSYEPRHRA